MRKERSETYQRSGDGRWPLHVRCLWDSGVPERGDPRAVEENAEYATQISEANVSGLVPIRWYEGIL